jgi:glycosyltransferase involved in cell wall biosynthesis
VLRISKSGVVSAWRERERQLRARGADLTLVSAARWEEGGTLLAVEPCDDSFVVPVRTVGHHPNFFLYDPRPLWRLLRTGGWDLIDMQEEPFGLAAAEVRLLMRLRCPHVPFVIFSAQNIDKRYPVPFRWFERSALRAAAGAYPCNVEAGEIMRRKGLAGDLVVLPLGVDLSRFHPVERQPPRGAVRVGFVGRLIPHKGVDVLLAAVALDDRLIADVFGAGPEEDALRAQAATLGIDDRVTFHGHVDESAVPSTYGGFDVLAVPSLPLPSWIEQFGRVVVEAQAAGVPVVASASGALPDVVGDAGLLVPPNDPAALAGAIGRMLDEPGLWAGLRTAGLERAPRYTWERVADTQMGLYRSATGTGPALDADRGHGAPPRVAFVDHCARRSGAELALARLLPALTAIEPVVVLGEDGPLAGMLRDQGIEVHVLAMGTSTREFSRTAVLPGVGAVRAALSTLAYSVRLARLLKRLGVRLVATNSLKSSLYGGLAGRLARVPVVWHVRDRIADDYLPSSAVRLVRLAARALPSGVIANSEATLSTLRLPGGAARRLRARAIGDPCPPEEFAVGAGRPGPGGAGDLTIGIVGRISPWKGQDVFLRAFARAFPEGGARARIVGGALFGEEEVGEELVALAEELGVADRVTFTGHVDDVAAELASLDIAVHASTIPEPFGQVVVEAMAAGVPVVATDAGGPAEVVTDGADGLLFPMGDVDGLADRLTLLASDADLRGRLVAGGRATAAAYAPSVIAAAVESTYRGILGA